jgi:two-component system NarL family response regulator
LSSGLSETERREKARSFPRTEIGSGTFAMEILPSRMSIRLLIVDDQSVVSAGFSSVLRSQAGLTVLSAVASGEEALRFLERFAVDVLLLDLHMPAMSGIETLLRVQELSCPPQVIVLSSFEPDEEICRAVEMGAKGYLRKDISCGEIVEAIRAVHSGSSYLPQWIVTQTSERRLRLSLTPRELEILEMVSKGLTNKDIGRAIRVSPFTVRNHVRHIIAKLEVGNRTEAASVAMQQGMLTAYDPLRSRPRDIVPYGNREKQCNLVTEDLRMLRPTQPFLRMQ